MKLPETGLAEYYLCVAAQLNPGPWVAHSQHAAEAARCIAERHPRLEPEAGYVLGLLHDIGRRAGVSGMRHILDGYHFMLEEGYPDVARICLTHSYPMHRVISAAPWDGSTAELEFVEQFITGVEYDDYDRLIQLCDCLTLPEGPVLMEKRLLDVALRYGVDEHTVPRWKSFLALREQFEQELGCSVYDLLPGVVKATFAK